MTTTAPKLKTPFQAAWVFGGEKSNHYLQTKPGPLVDHQSNIVPNVFTLSGTSLWERSTFLHVTLSNLTPWKETTLGRIADSGLWESIVWWKTQYRKNHKESTGLKQTNKSYRTIQINGIHIQFQEESLLHKMIYNRSLKKIRFPHWLPFVGLFIHSLNTYLLSPFHIHGSPSSMRRA